MKIKIYKICESLYKTGHHDGLTDEIWDNDEIKDYTDEIIKEVLRACEEVELDFPSRGCVNIDDLIEKLK